MSLDEVSVDHARSTTRRHAKTFSLACRFLPRDVRTDVYRLYQVFRTLDDLVDDHEPAAGERLDALARWCEGGVPESVETATLEALDRRTALPRDAFADFVAGMRGDLTNRPVETPVDLDIYCYRVAGTVGLVMAALLGADDTECEAAIALGKAMQLTNILRDVDADRAAGRQYLPENGATLTPGGRAELLASHIATADRLYTVGLEGIKQLPRGRFAIWSAALMYQEILRQLERDWRAGRYERASVSFARKLWVLLRHARTYPRQSRRARSPAAIPIESPGPRSSGGPYDGYGTDLETPARVAPPL